MKACPFCNYDEGWVKEVPEKGRTLYRVECKVCGSTGPKATSHKMAEWKWNGLLSKVDNIKDHIDDEEGLEDTDDPYDELYMSENIGGVVAPMSTIVNTLGVGDATTAPQAAVTGSDMNSNVKGSGDKWDNSKPKKKRKRKNKK